jgi:hypothetical protein
MGVAEWFSLGAIQVLEGPDGLWVFVDVDLNKSRPDKLASPSATHEVQFQRVVAFNRDGVQYQNTLTPGPSFNRNLGFIFRYGPSFYLFAGQSMGSPERMYIWRDGRFRLLDGEGLIEITKQLGLAGDSPAAQRAKLEAVTRAEGWRIVYTWIGGWPGADEIKTETHGIKLRFVQNGTMQSIVASSTNDRRWEVTLVEIETARGKCERAPGERKKEHRRGGKS